MATQKTTRRFLAPASAILLALSGCSAEMATRQPFSNSAPALVTVEETPYGPPELEVRLLSDRAWVEPTNKWHREHAFRGSTDRWLATVEDQKRVYQSALLLALKERAPCQIKSSTPSPGFFAFEFAYTCP